MQLSGCRALVTGGSTGIGFAIAKLLSAKGAKVVLTSRSQSNAEEAASQIPDAEGIAVDLIDPAAQDRFVTLVAERWPDLGLLVNNAGMQVTMPDVGIETTGLNDSWRDEIALNLTAPAVLSAGLLPTLSRQAEAAIVNISSGLAIAPKRTAPVYCATKAGLRSFTQAMRYRCEDAAPNVRMIDAVMALVDTNMTAGRGKNKLHVDEAAKAVVDGIIQDKETIWVGKSGVLSLLSRIAPKRAALMLRNG